MPTTTPTTKKPRAPKYCHHKGSDLAYVTLNGKEVYLGRYGSPESRREYARVVGEHLASDGCSPAARTGADLSVVELIAAFWRHAQTHYRKPDGRPTGEIKNYRDVLRPLKRLYGETALADFGPLSLRALRDEMIRMGWCRTYINRQTHRVRHVFGWGVGRELVAESVHAALMRVEPLEEGRTDARESDEVEPVEEEHFRAALPFLSAQVRAMAEVQWYTGARPDEVLHTKTGEIEMGDEDWIYRPVHHKNEHRGHPREIPLGPRARAIVEPLLKRDDPEAFIFSPRDAMKAHREARRAARKTPMSCGTVAGENVKARPAKGPGDHYTVESYCKRIHAACDLAFPPPPRLERQRVPGNGRKAKSMRRETDREWRARLGDKGWAELVKWRHDHRFSPHQIRHTAATRIRATHGLEVAQCLLGHSSITATQIYAKKNMDAARKLARAVG